MEYLRKVCKNERQKMIFFFFIEISSLIQSTLVRGRWNQRVLICGTYIHTCRNKTYLYIYTKILEVNLFVLYTNVNSTKGKGESFLLDHLHYKVIIYLFFVLLIGRGGLDSPLSLF